MIQRVNHYMSSFSRKTKILFAMMLVGFSSSSFAQETRSLTLQEAISLGIKNSKVLRLSQAKIEQAISKYNQTKDAVLPTGNVAYIYNHAQIPTTSFKLTPESDPLHLPGHAEAFLGTFSLQEVVFAANKLQYAKKSTDLLTQVARLDADKDKDDIAFNITNAYLDLYKIQQSKKLVEQNIQAVDQQIHQSQRFFEQGLVTKNDVLRFQLQKSNIQLTGVDLETNRKIVVYNLDILLGLPESTDLTVSEVTAPVQQIAVNNFIDSALANRQELKALNLRSQAAGYNIKSIKADAMPTLLAGVDAYYINPSNKFIPPANMYIAPVTAGLTLAWNFDRLWMNKNKVAEAKIQKSQVDISRDITEDRVKTEVNQDYQNYQKALDRIQILKISIQQAQENDKILESKYRNNVASATDRIDAQTQLYQALINLELAKADAVNAYYTLLKSTGTITK